MPTLEDELRRYGDLLDATATTAEPGHDVAVTEAAPPRRAVRTLLAAAAVVVIVATVAVVVGTRSTHEVPPGSSAHPAVTTTTTTVPTTPLPVSVQRTSLGFTAQELLAGVVTDAERWQALWQGQTAPPVVDFARDAAFFVDVSAACAGPPVAHLQGSTLTVSWPIAQVGCPSSPTRWTLAVPRDRLPSVLTYAPMPGGSLRVTLGPRAFAFVDTQPTRNAAPECVIHANFTAGPVAGVTIRLPDGRTYPIVTGNPITAPDGITVDGDGSTDIGASPSDATSLLWGSANGGGPFGGLDGVAIGSTINLSQRNGGSNCTQAWRVLAVTSADVLDSAGASFSQPGLRLTLVGFEPTNAGPDVRFYVFTAPR